MRMFPVLTSLLVMSLNMGVQAEWQLVYKGKRLKGDKTRLMDAVRLGLPIRIAWGAVDPQDKTQYVEHIMTPVFVTVASGKEVLCKYRSISRKPATGTRNFKISKRLKLCGVTY